MQETPKGWKCIEGHEHDDFTDKTTTTKCAVVQSETGEILMFHYGPWGALTLTLLADVEPGDEGDEYRIFLRVDDGPIYSSTYMKFAFGKPDNPLDDQQLIPQMRRGQKIRVRYMSEDGQKTATFSLKGFEGAFLDTFGRFPSR